MILYSTSNPENKVNFTEALLKAYPMDKGLYFPESIPICSSQQRKEMRNQTFAEIATTLSTLWLADEIPYKVLKEICEEAFNFEIPMVSIAENCTVLELFQGPTMAFKDFGARFMAKVLEWILKKSPRKTIVLTATSGDTGGAVASGFSGIPNLEVVILFPNGKVSPLQRKQLTTQGDNIHAIAIQGNFDDCQKLVKEALIDEEIGRAAQFCSANSINIARLIPQSFYYFYAMSRVDPGKGKVVFSVPSGNFGNLTAGLFAKRMGLEIDHFIAATNENDTVPKYLQSGKFLPHDSYETMATAMDVGNPSNFVRMLALFDHNHYLMKALIAGIKVSNQEISQAIYNTYQAHSYILDPHAAVAIKAFQKYTDLHTKGTLDSSQGIILGTAHPAKFPETVEKAINQNLESSHNIPLKGEIPIKIELPYQLSELLGKTEKFKTLAADFKLIKEYLLEEALE